MMRSIVLAAMVSVLTAACALRLGAPDPEPRTTVALDVAAATPAATVANTITGANADVVLLAADADAAWVEAVARSAGLQHSRPGRSGERTLAFLTRTPAIGDTTITLTADDGATLVVHDALYDVPGKRHLDLLAFRIDQATPLRSAMRALLAYIATDVMPDAAVAIAVQVDTPARGDSVAAMLSPAFTDVRNCDRAGDAQPHPATIRLLYGPEIRMSCDRMSVLSATGLQARLVVGGR